MTYQRHWLLSWGGTVADGTEIFANNVRFQNSETGASDTIADGDLEALLDGYVLDLRALFARAGSYIPATVSCLWVKFNEIGPDGLYVNKTTTHARYLAGDTGPLARINGTSGIGGATFLSACITTTTARQRGPGSKGRLFVPQCSAPVGGNGRFSSTTATALATSWSQFFTALGDEEGIDNTAAAPAVVSNVGEPGPVERITGVKVGNVPDVQRRRKNALDEVYVSASVSTG